MFYYGDILRQRTLRAACNKGESFLGKIDFNRAKLFRGRALSLQGRFHSYLLQQLFWRRTVYE